MNKKRAIPECIGVYKGVQYEVLFGEVYHRCGYMYLSASDPLFKIKNTNDLEEIFGDVHGGITWIDFRNTDKKSIAIGFDCAHYNDAPDMVSAEKYFGAIDKELEFYFNSRIKYGDVKTLDFCIKECKKMIRTYVKIKKEITAEMKKRPENFI